VVLHKSARFIFVAPCKASEIQSPEMAIAVKVSQQPRTESCVGVGNDHREA
jgi:hypothetical protein